MINMHGVSQKYIRSLTFAAACVIWATLASADKPMPGPAPAHNADIDKHADARWWGLYRSLVEEAGY